MGRNKSFTIENNSINNIHAVLFDIGDTLIDASKIMSIAIDKAVDVLYQYDFIKNKTEFKKIYMKIDSRIHGSQINHLFSNLCIIKEAWRETGLNPSYSAYGLFLAELRKTVRKNIKVKKDLVDLFRSLKMKKIKIGIVSDGTLEEQLETLAFLGIIQFVDVIIISEDFGIEALLILEIEYPVYLHRSHQDRLVILPHQKSSGPPQRPGCRR